MTCLNINVHWCPESIKYCTYVPLRHFYTKSVFKGINRQASGIILKYPLIPIVVSCKFREICNSYINTCCGICCPVICRLTKNHCYQMICHKPYKLKIGCNDFRRHILTSKQSVKHLGFNIKMC